VLLIFKKKHLCTHDTNIHTVEVITARLKLTAPRSLPLPTVTQPPLPHAGPPFLQPFVKTPAAVGSAKLMVMVVVAVVAVVMVVIMVVV
jgi:hypothetical protein